MRKRTILFILSSAVLTECIWCWISIVKTPDKSFYGICIDNEQEYITVYPFYLTSEYEKTERLHHLSITTDSKTQYYNTKGEKAHRADFDKGYVAEIIYSSDEAIVDDGRHYTLRSKELRLTDRRIMTEAPNLTVYSGNKTYLFEGLKVTWSFSIGGGKQAGSETDYIDPVLRKLDTVINDGSSIELEFDIKPSGFKIYAWPGELLEQEFDWELVNSKKLTVASEGYTFTMQDNPDGWVIQICATWPPGKYGELDKWGGSGEYAFFLTK